MVPQAIGISLCNRIGDSAGEFLVVVPRGFYRHSMFLNCSYFSVSVSGMGACFPGSVWIGVNFVSVHLFAFIFIHFSSYMWVFLLTVAYTRGFYWYICIHTRVYCKQSRMPLVFPYKGILVVSRWILMIAESPLILLESVYTSVSNQRHFFRVNFFKKVLVMAFSIFCLRLVH